MRLFLDNDEISEKLNNFFADIVKNLNILQYKDHLVNTDNIDDSILRTTEKFNLKAMRVFS